MDKPPPPASNAPAPSRQTTVRPAGATPVRIDSGTLLGAVGEVVILHAGREYRLRQTQHGKLILTA